jgi:two-component system sensor histidine kinase BaeS
MHLKLWHKFALVLISTGALVLLAALIFSQQSFKRGFLEYLNAQEGTRLNYLGEQLIDDYQRYEGWSFIKGDPELWRRYVRQVFEQATRQGLFPELGPQYSSRRPGSRDDFQPPPPRRQGDGRPPPPNDGQRPPRRQGDRRPPPIEGRRPPPPPRSQPLLNAALLDMRGSLIAGMIDNSGKNNRLNLSLNDGVIATLVVRSVDRFTHQADREFILQQNIAFLRIAGISIVLISLLAWLLGRVFNGRVLPLSKMAHRLAEGDFENRLRSNNKDELGGLSQDLNVLADTLEKNRTSRQRWIADISHELRTPVSILQGELEALQDGIRPLNLAAIASLKAEISRLTGLIEDLYQLSMADVGALSYRFELLNLSELISGALDTAGTQLDEHSIVPDFSPGTEAGTHIHADSDRINQLLNNLLQNTLRYTDSPGCLSVELMRTRRGDKDYLLLLWSDSSPGVEDPILGRLFDRMTRVDDSRNRKTGGAGLGLAIVKELVKGHGGFVKAQTSHLGGLTIEIGLPLAPMKPGEK